MKSHINNMILLRLILSQGLFTMVLAALLAASAPFTARAQSGTDVPFVSGAWAIQNATIIQEPGRVIERGTVVVRDGVIESVGRRVTIPWDADVIDGDSLTVVAGFIDALSNAGLPEPKRPDNLPSVPDRSNPPPERAGIQPQVDVRDHLDPNDKSVDAYRKLGFTAAHVVPHGGMLPGTGAVALLHNDNMRFGGPTDLFLEFEGARGVYPGTPMGIMAKVRQLYRESERRLAIERLYADNPGGLSRPLQDPIHEAFFPVVRQEQAVLVFTDDALEIHRAFDLQAALGFQLKLAGLSGAFDALPALRDAGIPLAVTMALPEKADWMKEIKDDSLAAMLESFEVDPDLRTATFRDIEAERRNLEIRQLRSRQQYVAMPALFEQEGIEFAFATYGMETKEIMPNLRAMIDAGLSVDAALAALTVHAAAFAGVDATQGRIAEGYMANLTIVKGALFSEDMKVVRVFVDGTPVNYEEQ